MPKPTLNSVLDVQDPMLNDNFDLTFASIPGGGGETRQMTIQCKTATKPGTSITEVEISLFGHKVLHGAKREWSTDMSIEFIEDRNGSITRALEDWAEYIRGRESQHGAFKADYAVNGIFTIYDQEGEVAMKYKIRNMWPSQVPDLEFDGEGGQNVPLSASFKYDHVERER